MKEEDDIIYGIKLEYEVCDTLEFEYWHDAYMFA